MSKIVDTFKKLVTIDSPSGEEKEISNYLQNYLHELGFNVKVDPLNQILASSGHDDTLLISGHMDTVSPGIGIKPSIKKGYLVSNGQTILGADNKACISAILVAIEEYKSIHQTLPPVEILFTAKEETGGGVDQFPPEWIKSKYGITFDIAKPLGKIALSAPYIYNFKVTFCGKAAHSSRPEEGLNALTSAMPLINSLKVGRIDNETTVNIGKVIAGTGINIIPYKVVIEGEIRSINQKTFLNLIKKIKNNTKKISENTKVKISFELSGYCPGYKYNKADPFIAKIKKLLEKNNIKTEFYNSTGVSDANILVDKGINFVCMSDSVENPHTTDEKISIKNLTKLKNLVLYFMEETSLLN